MQLTPLTFLIVCPMLFLAGLVDAIGGGGGLISLPAYALLCTRTATTTIRPFFCEYSQVDKVKSRRP